MELENGENTYTIKRTTKSDSALIKGNIFNISLGMMVFYRILLVKKSK